MADRVDEVSATAGDDELVRYATPKGRWVLLATILGSGVAMLDGTVVKRGAAVIGEDLGANAPACSGPQRLPGSRWPR